MRSFLMALALVVICMTAAPITAMAFNPFGGEACGGQNNQSAACQANNTDPISGNNGVLIRAANILAYLGGAVAVIMIIVAAIRFITSGSDVSTGSRTDTDVEEARRTIAGALAGLAIIILARTLIAYVINKL